MYGWLDEFTQWICGSKRRPPFRRHIELGEDARGWFTDGQRTLDDRETFAELLLKLDADPVSCSSPVLDDPPVAGLRYAVFETIRVVFIFDPGRNRLRIATIRLIQDA